MFLQKKGYIDKNQFVALTSTNAARIFNLFPSKGYVGVGSDADLVIWRENQYRSLAPSAAALAVTKSDCSNALEGAESNGSPAVVVCRGKIVFQDDEVGNRNNRNSGAGVTMICSTLNYYYV